MLFNAAALGCMVEYRRACGQSPLRSPPTHQMQPFAPPAPPAPPTPPKLDRAPQEAYGLSTVGLWRLEFGAWIFHDYFIIFLLITLVGKSCRH